MHGQTSRGLLDSPFRCIRDLDESMPQTRDLHGSPFGIVFYTVDRAKILKSTKVLVSKYLASRTDLFLMQKIHASSHACPLAVRTYTLDEEHWRGAML